MLSGETFNWSFLHKARAAGIDSMRLIIDGVEQGRWGSTNTAWQNYTGSYSLVGASRTVRFSFEAISTVTGDASVGNFLDDITISGLQAFPLFDSTNFSTLESNNNPPLVLISGTVAAASTVVIQITGGTATNGTDYLLNSTTINVPAGVYDGTSATGIPVPITVINDFVPEADETFSIEITNATGSLALISATCKPIKTTIDYTILDDDCPPKTTSACEGEAVTLNFNYNSPNTVNWYKKVGGTLLQSNSPNYTNTFTSLPDTVYAEGIWTNTKTCFSEYIIEKTTITQPNITLSKSTICAGDTVRVSIPNTTNTHSWQITGSQSFTIKGDTIAVIVGSTQDIEIKLSTISGLCSIDTTFKITANPIFSPITSDTSYCLNDIALALTATSSSGNSLLWYTTPTGGIGNTSALTPSTTTARTFNFYVSELSTDGCEGVRDTITVTIKDLPVAPIGADTSYCLNSSSKTLSATALSGNSLLWYTTATGGMGNTTSPTPLTTTIGTTSYYVSQVVDKCEGPRTTIKVTIHSIPSPVITIDNPDICMGSSTQLQVINPNSSYMYTWEPNGQTQTSIQSNENGVFNVIANFNGCSVKSNTLTLNVHTISIEAGGPYLIGENKCLDINPSVKNTFAPLAYTWTDLSNGGILGGDQTSMNICPTGILKSNFYSVTVQNGIGCTATDDFTITIRKPIFIPEIITPNGDEANDTWTIKHIETYPKSVIKLYNRWGQLVFNRTGYLNNWGGTKNGQPLPVATYYYIIELNEKGEEKPYSGSLTIIR